MTNKIFGVALLVLSLAGGTMAQSNSEPKAVPREPAVIIPLSTGTAINASLLGTLDSARSKPGDQVTAIVTEAVVYQRSILLPKGSRIVGQVVRTGADGESTAALFVQFDRVVLKNGQEAILNAGIQALAPVSAAPTIATREKYEEERLSGPARMTPGYSPSEPSVVPSTYTLPKRILPESQGPKLEGGLDRKGLFTPDSKGAFSEPGVKVFTPVSEGSHGTVLVGNQKSVHLESGTHLLIVIQPPTH
jgi:hypothetical protein